MAFHRESSDTNIWRVPVDGSIDKPQDHSPVKVVGSSQRDEFPSLSPDGSRIAFASTQSGAREIWLTDIDGNSPRQLTNFGGGDVAHPRWSPDGKSITFDASPAERSMIFVCDVDSGLTRIAANDRANSIVPSWSSDGSHIYYSANDGAGWDVWKIAATGGTSVRVTMSGGVEAHESPDGQNIYYNKDGYYTTGIFRQSVAGGPEVQVSDLPQLWSVGDWRLSGSGIYFIHRYKQPHVLDSSPAIKFLEFQTGRITDVAQLESDPGGDPGLSLSPDGKYLFYSRTDAHTSDIMLIDNFH